MGIRAALYGYTDGRQAASSRRGECDEVGWQGWNRTSDRPVNSRLLYR